MSDLVARWRAQMSRPHVIIAETREIGTAMANEIERLRAELEVARRQWKMYAELQEDRDLETEQSAEGALWRGGAHEQSTRDR